jgi:queuosine precursor transporter
MIVAPTIDAPSVRIELEDAVLDSGEAPSPGPRAMLGSDLSYTMVSTLVIGYVLIQLGANLTAIKTVALFGNHPIPAGTLLYALSFTWINLITEYLGTARARRLVLISVGANVLMISWFQLVIGLPGTSLWVADPGHQDALSFVLGSVPRIYLASIITSTIVENVDISVFTLIKHRAPAVPLWLRSMASNTVAAPLDGLLFAVLAFGGTASPAFIVSLVVTSAVYKLAVSYISVPLMYAVKLRWTVGSRRAELRSTSTV